MSTAENKVFATRILEEFFSQGNLNNIDELFSPDIVVHDPDKELHGLEQVKEGIARLRIAFPDLHYTAEDMIAEGDKVVTRWMAKGTPQIEFAGIKPAGKPVTVTAIHIHRVRDHKLVEHWEAINLHAVRT